MFAAVRPVALVASGAIASSVLVACTSGSGSTAIHSTTHASKAAVSQTPSATASAHSASAPTTPAPATPVIHSADPASYRLGGADSSEPAPLVARTVSFQTPSHNIRCTLLDQQQLTCEIADHTFASAPRPSSCQLNWLGSDVTLGTSGAVRGICAGNPVVIDNSTVLPYGYRLTVGLVSCLSTDAALSCTAGTHGFTLNRTEATLR